MVVLGKRNLGRLTMIYKMFNIFTKPLFAALVALAMVVGVQFPANSQEISPDTLSLARQYVDLTDNAQIFETNLIRTGIETMRTVVSQNPEMAEDVSAAIGVVIEAYSTRKDELFDQFARVYALRFTDDELREIVVFYQTDVGRKLATSNSIINTELSTVMQIYQANLNIEFFAQVRAELREKGIEL